MKNKLLSIGLLSVVGLALSAGDANAWFLRKLCCNHCATTITVRPYNAFTPFCFGNLVCDGCCPIPSCGYGGPLSGCAPACGPSCGPIGGNYGLGCQSAPQFIPGPVGSPVVLPGNPGYAPLPSAPMNNTSYMPQPSYGLQPAGYQPAYGYYPTPAYPPSYNPYTAPSPYYWYNNR